jgi:hypothetical protein
MVGVEELLPFAGPSAEVSGISVVAVEHDVVLGGPNLPGAGS